MKKMLMSAIMVTTMLSVTACGGQTTTSGDKSNTAAPKQWAMGTSSSGSSPYVLGGAISKLLNEKQKVLKVSPQVTGGYEENISLISKGTVHVAQATLDQLNDSYAGKGRYEGDAKKDIRALFNVALMPLHLAVLNGSNIKTGDDLKGKKVNIASPKQATYTIAVKYLEALGMTVKDITPGALSTKDAPGALKDKQQEAIFLASTLPLPGLVEIAVSEPIRLIPIEGKVADTFIQKMEGSLIKTKIPANTYNGMKEDINTVASPISLYVSEKASEEEVYQFTKTFWENLDQFHKEFAAGSTLTKDIALQGINVPLHPGAQKYFKEIGLLK